VSAVASGVWIYLGTYVKKIKYGYVFPSWLHTTCMYADLELIPLCNYSTGLVLNGMKGSEREIRGRVRLKPTKKVHSSP
jgi:uncharacterized membrane protein YhdT